MEKPSFKQKFFWLISGLILTILMFAGYSELRYSGNTLSLSIPDQKNNLKLGLDDYLFSDAVELVQEYTTNKKRNESPTSLNYSIEVENIFKDSSLFYSPNEFNKQFTSGSDNSTGSEQKSSKLSSDPLNTLTATSRSAKQSRVVSFEEALWSILYFNTNLGYKKFKVVDGSALRPDKKNQVQYTSMGKDNEFNRTRINSEGNTQRNIQLGIGNSTSQKLINTFNSDLMARSIGSDNFISQQVFNGYNANLSVVQNGSSNNVRQELYSKNVIDAFYQTENEIRQTGSYNIMKSQQLGISNSLKAIQVGNNNSIEVKQNDVGNSVTVSQSGAANSVIIKQQ